MTGTALASRTGTPTVDVAFQGARRGYSLPHLFERAGILGTFYTDTYLGNKPWLQRSLKRVPSAIAPAALRRCWAGNTPLLHLPGCFLLTRWAGRRCGCGRARNPVANCGATTRRCAKSFASSWCETGLVARRRFTASNRACLEIFRAARRHGMLCIMEQNSAAERIEDELVREEVRRWKGWERSIEQELADSDVSPLRDREEAEWPLADAIVCPSDFVASGLKSLGVADEKCKLLPYGIDTAKFQPKQTARVGGGLNLLFTGFVGLRKGVPYLLEALRLLHSREMDCRLVGTVELDRRRLDEYAPWMEVLGPIPRTEIMRMYRLGRRPGVAFDSGRVGTGHLRSPRLRFTGGDNAQLRLSGARRAGRIHRSHSRSRGPGGPLGSPGRGS